MSDARPDLKSKMRSIYHGRRVLVTGYTGFKGSWLCLWLESMGAELSGYSLPAPSNPSHFELLKKAGSFKNARFQEGDIRDLEKLSAFVREVNPEIVFHLAAQPIVRLSYDQPIETYETNVMGTLKVFEACRRIKNVRAIVNVTSDKCYENREWIWGYRENEPMGGFDPYSSSKGCAEILTSSYRRSYFHPSNFEKTHSTLLGSVRAGNVIGGGDWAPDRLIPDIARATSEGRTTEIRQPQSVRPWQHVLEPLAGYLALGGKLLNGSTDFADGWNFGPDADGGREVQEVMDRFAKSWPKAKFEAFAKLDQSQRKRSVVHEANLLQLDSSKARRLLDWTPRLTFDETVKWTAGWYRTYYDQGQVISAEQLAEFEGRN